MSFKFAIHVTRALVAETTVVSIEAESELEARNAALRAVNAPDFSGTWVESHHASPFVTLVSADINVGVHSVPLPEQYDTPKFEVRVSPWESRGHFIHLTQGENYAGNLWFSGKALVDYDGCAYLPSEVADALRAGGYDVPAEVEES